MSFRDFVRNQRAKLPAVPPPPATITAATYIVTGANTGIGLECAKHLVTLGAARVILAVRSRAKGEAALASIQAASGRGGSEKGAMEVWELDLASLTSVESFAKRVDALDRLDGLVENAGVAMTHFEAVEGMERNITVNVIGTMLLAVRALPKLQATAQRFGMPTHLVVVSSDAAITPNMKGTVEQFEGDMSAAVGKEKNFAVFTQYPRSKLLQMYAVRQLASLLPVSTTGVVINLANPGLCNSELARNAPLVGKVYIGLLRKLVGRTAEEGSRTLLAAVFAGVDSHGKYFSEAKLKEHAIPTWLSDEAGARTQRRVWEELVKILEARGHSVELGGLFGSKKVGI